MTKQHIDEQILLRYLAGELGVEENFAVEAWYEQSPQNKMELQSMYDAAALYDCISVAGEIDAEKPLCNLKMRIIRRKKRKNLLRMGRRWAAAAVFLGLLSWSTYVSLRHFDSPSDHVTVYTQFAERSQAVLPDGTKVWLNSCSRIEYSSPPFSRERRINMDGEVYFEVSRNPRKPLKVSVNGMEIKVVGTRFNIFSDTVKQTVTTVLLEGAVEVLTGENRDSPIRLAPSQQLVYDARTGETWLSYCDAPKKIIDWIDGCLNFQDNTFDEIATELKRYFNIDIRFMDERLRGERFSGTFEVEDGVYHIASVLQLTGKFDYRIVDNHIEISAKK